MIVTFHLPLLPDHVNLIISSNGSRYIREQKAEYSGRMVIIDGKLGNIEGIDKTLSLTKDNVKIDNPQSMQLRIFEHEEGLDTIHGEIFYFENFIKNSPVFYMTFPQ